MLAKQSKRIIGAYETVDDLRRALIRVWEQCDNLRTELNSLREDLDNNSAAFESSAPVTTLPQRLVLTDREGAALVKCFEVRDRATLIPVMAIVPYGDTTPAGKLLRRGGFTHPETYVFLAQLSGRQFEARYDSRGWPNNRSMTTAHQYIQQHFHTLKSGDVIDIEFILGESKVKKESEL